MWGSRISAGRLIVCWSSISGGRLMCRIGEPAGGLVWATRGLMGLMRTTRRLERTAVTSRRIITGIR